ncbi:MAG: ABC transporter ATP-binding protein [Planctomycetes bacterium]|nr:ABC transporter ATP-binding protein [Planctomycetota bacterium]
MSALLEVKDLVVKYGAIEALHGISLTVNQGEIVSLIGSNGAGKTTTLRAISGIRRAASGSIVFNGADISRQAAHAIVRSGLVQSPEGRGVFPNMTVAENLDLGAFIRNDHAEIAKDLERALGLFPRLRERMGQMAGTLSGGEQQMLAMARAMLTKPRLLLLDEPSLGLAPQIVQTIFKIIREINASGTTILLVEQNARMALQVSHRAYVLETGKIVNQGDAKELASSDVVRKAYLGH